jgi:hypothetical protein
MRWRRTIPMVVRVCQPENGQTNTGSNDLVRNKLICKDGKIHITAAASPHRGSNRRITKLSIPHTHIPQREANAWRRHKCCPLSAFT